MIGEVKTIAVQPRGRVTGFFYSQPGVGTEKMSVVTVKFFAHRANPLYAAY